MFGHEVCFHFGWFDSRCLVERPKIAWHSPTRLRVPAARLTGHAGNNTSQSSMKDVATSNSINANLF
jgi:hypothetical protein